MKLHSLIKVARTDTTWIILSHWLNENSSVWRIDIFSPTWKKIYSRANFHCFDEARKNWITEKSRIGAKTKGEREEVLKKRTKPREKKVVQGFNKRSKHIFFYPIEN